jgi:enediyne biosynthesis protein E4
MKRLYRHNLLYILAVLLVGCDHNRQTALFTSLTPAQTGIDFRNDIREDDSTDSFIDEFGYMGGGVGIGDFNNDGRKDIFFTGNQTSCRLYINKGNNSFEDITEKAGLSTHIWATGVSIVDINGDGYDDIYVCAFGKDLLHPAKNLLFINQHNLTFKEEAAEYGLADSGYCTQAVFLDYDKDGDLDMYLSRYLLNGPNANTVYPKDLSGHSNANDKLYRNDGDIKGLGHPVFTDVTLQANIKDCGYGLGVVASDLNGDGWPDIYVGDDFVSDDLLWLNNRNGTFTDRLASSIRHTSYSTMGVDVADLNNDGLPDIVSLDMLPEDNRRKKMTTSFMNYERYRLERSMGYEPQFMRNMLQLNNGNYQKGDTSIPFFSEIGQMAGISATDWSWSVLLADFNNDGWKDMHITNGIGRDFINADFLDFSNTVFSGDQAKKDQRRQIREKLASLDHINLKNYLYLNDGDYHFANASEKAGIDIPSMSGGAAYVDLDNDGDLDLVVNNIDAAPFIFINNTIQKGLPVTRHFLKVQLKGDKGNGAGFGAKIWVSAGGNRQMQEQSPVRGYFSSVDQTLLFGLGPNTRVDSLVINWPDDRRQTIYDVHADSLLTLEQKNASLPLPQRADKKPPLFTDAAAETNILYRHKENVYNDFAAGILIPQKYSQLAPFIATGDINNDGLTDFFIGGAFNVSGRFFIQQPDGRFVPENLSDSIKLQEDMDCVLFDADGDGDLDLLVTCGDRLYEENSVNYIPRLYLNDGKGHFTLAKDAIPPEVKTSAGCVTIGDLDGDGQPDIFIGGRISAKYPLPPHSFILHNNKGVFTDITEKVCPAIAHAGMITSAKWVDFDNDKQADLVIAGEWMPIRFFKNDHGILHEVTAATGLTAMNGMWRSLAVADVDGDGDMDIIAGNLGLNCEYEVSEQQPMELFATDLDHNGSIDPVFCYYVKDEDGIKRSYPAVSRKKLAEQVPFIKKQFLYNKDYANARFDDIYKARAGDTLLSLFCNETRSCWFENTGNGRFIKHPLPPQAQFAPVNAILCADVDQDGRVDLLLAGNEYQAEVMRGRYDASYGCLLKGNGHAKDRFTYSPGADNGLLLQGDIKNMALINSTRGYRLLLAAANDDSLQVYKIK